MKYLIFSDTHLHDFEEKKYEVLKNAIEQSDRVIINGDFWEGMAHEYSFEHFITSPWSELFPLLLSKQAVYIYGNHDKEKLSKDQASLFSVKQTTHYEATIGNRTYIFEHGNRLCPFFDDDPKQLYTLEGLMMFAFGRHIAEPITRLVGMTGIQNLKKMGKKFNERIKKQLKTELKENEVYVCGHTHVAEVDLENKFINSGFTSYGFAQYIYIEGNKITPVSLKY